MLKCGMITKDYLDWGKPFAKGIHKIEIQKDLPTGSGSNGVIVTACCKELEHNIPKILEVPKLSFPSIRSKPFQFKTEINRKIQMRFSKGPINDEKHKPTTNQDLLDESNEHTKTREK